MHLVRGCAGRVLDRYSGVSKPRVYLERERGLSSGSF